MFASPYTLFFLIATLPYDSLAFPAQIPLQLSTSTLTKPRKLRGRFLQVSDIHPDPYYTPKTSLEKSCHRKKPKKKQPKAGYYGTPFSGCDTPFVLSNFTLDYLGQEWASEIDFVVWTGDNARHDNDHRLPRTPDEIFELNRAVAQKMKDVFLSKGIPVVPSLGNNDVWPHNILSPGPNSVTTEFSNIWESFIPFPYLQVFHRGAYYSVEVVPGKVAVIAMNTMYFYDSNKAVGGCPFHEPDDPGNLQLDWLEVQLKEYRNRNIQVWISGHVPPSPGNYFPDCYVRYVELGLRFQDTILGHLFGHMNADHFSFLEAIDLEFIEDPDAGAQNNVGLFNTLVREFEAIPTKEKDLDLAEYAVVNTSPPVVPNPYMPSFRIFAYNHTGNDGSDGGYEPAGKKRRHGHHRGNPHDKEKQCRKKEHRDTWKCFLNETWHSDPESPSRSNKQWTPLGYAQYYLPNLDQFTKKHKPKFELEYVTFEPGSLHPEGIDPPIPLRHLPKSLRDPGVTESKYAPYEMADLTIPSWIKLAQEMGSGKSKKLRKKFFSYMYMGGDEA